MIRERVRIADLRATLGASRTVVVQAIEVRELLVDGALLETLAADRVLPPPLRVKSAAIGRLLITKLDLLWRANPEQPMERLVQSARDELEHAFYAQARRRFRSCFASGEP